MKLKTLKDIENEEIELWRRSCKKEVFAQILLNQMKKRKLLNIKQVKLIQNNIDIIGEHNCAKLKGTK